MDMQVENVSSGETNAAAPAEIKVTPPVLSKRGRKPGQKNGEGKTSRTLRLPKAKAKAKPELSAAEAIEAIGAPAKADPVSDAPVARKKKSVQVEKHKLGKTVQGLYKGASMLTGIEEFDIGEDKAQALSGALLDVFAEFDIEVSSKSAAVANCIGTVMFIHAPIAMAIRSKAPRRARTPKPAPVDLHREEPPLAEPILDANFFDQSAGG
jgi:hypothetical protein